MIINYITIKRFRGFEDVTFKLGTSITVIAGQNGTQKTTLLGMLSQPFSITDPKNPIRGKKPLCGGNYRSSFAEKFKLSDVFDKPKMHKWTLTLSLDNIPDFTVESIYREDPKNANIRFWKKGDRSQGSGYIQRPVIYLSLSRLFPMGEDKELNLNTEITFTEDEVQFYQQWHDKILIIPNVLLTKANYLSSKNKNTVGVNTDFYDWKMNSAGQDNIGKILLAILSFKRLKDEFKETYNGGVLVIDELDATLYPASQIKLVEALCKFSSDYNIQIIFTTHSLGILEYACGLQHNPKRNNQIKVIYLEKVDNRIKAIEEISFNYIKNKLSVLAGFKEKQPNKIFVFTEDKEGEIFFRSLLKRKLPLFKFIGGTFGCNNLIELVVKNVPGFQAHESLIILDGDISDNLKNKVKKLKNVFILPGDKSPEMLIASFLHQLSDEAPIWNEEYYKQFVFKDYPFKEIQDREKAKQWFNQQKKYWGPGGTRMFNFWIRSNKDKADNFVNQIDNYIKEDFKI